MFEDNFLHAELLGKIYYFIKFLKNRSGFQLFKDAT